MTDLVIACTGHRPSKLGGYGKKARDKLVKIAKTYLNIRYSDKIISGMAIGWDQAFAEAARDTYDSCCAI